MMNDCISRPSLLDDDQYIRKADQPLFCVASSYKADGVGFCLCVLCDNVVSYYFLSHFLLLLFEPLLGCCCWEAFNMITNDSAGERDAVSAVLCSLKGVVGVHTYRRK